MINYQKQNSRECEHAQTKNTKLNSINVNVNERNVNDVFTGIVIVVGIVIIIVI